jgi:hypothetical protein
MSGAAAGADVTEPRAALSPRRAGRCGAGGGPGGAGRGRGPADFPGRAAGRPGRGFPEIDAQLPASWRRRQSGNRPSLSLGAVGTLLVTPAFTFCRALASAALTQLHSSQPSLLPQK